MYRFFLILPVFIFNSLFASLPNTIDLSLEEKVGQIIMAYFHGEQINAEARELVQEGKVGGIIYYGNMNGLTSPIQIQRLSKGLQLLALKNNKKIPLFIAVDQEGGKVMRCREGFTEFPGNWFLAQTNDPLLVKRTYQAMGEELKVVGINMNLAPVVDINSEKKKSVMGSRVFSSKLEDVLSLAGRALDGLHEAGEFSVIKHYPGHGCATLDSHKGLPVVFKDIEDLKKQELRPFQVLQDKTDAIMTGHMMFPKIDEDRPATLSKKLIDGVLRGQMGYQGLVITDSLTMGAIRQMGISLEESAIQSLEAGCDILLLGGPNLIGGFMQGELFAKDVLALREAVIEAVRLGRISEKRLDQSVERVLALKANKKLTFSQALTEEDTGNIVLSKKHVSLANELVQSLAEQQPNLTDKQLEVIGQKIWMNECAGSVEGLTSWNIGENFASLGIGHFIWSPKGKKKLFTEPFPSLIQYLKENKVKIPQWLETVQACPWSHRKAFLAAKNSEKMRVLRGFLARTKFWQVRFIAKRFQEALPKLLKNLSLKEQYHVLTQYKRILREDMGLYVLVDYINFKGEGLRVSEKYQGQGWGLLQVLERMKGDPYQEGVLDEFVASAKELLTLRVCHAPAERNESKWLAGWYKRLNTYLGDPS